MEFLSELKLRNEVLYLFGLVNLITAFVLIALSFLKPMEFGGTNAWYKPIKFALSILVLSWALAWYTGYLGASSDMTIVNWIIVITLGFEVIYIAYKASQGQASHYNQSTPLNAAMFSLMAFAASIATLAIGYIGLKFWATNFENLPDYYVWAIRLGIVLFVIFSFQGFVMGATGAHTIGGSDGSKGLPFLNWSRTLGDLRVAHFIGMHALQVLPILAYFLLKDIRLTFFVAILYGLLACYVLAQALQAKPFLKFLQ